MDGILLQSSYKLLGKLVLLLAFFVNFSYAKAESRLVVAILDTGVSITDIDRKYLCDLPHESFVDFSWNNDEVGHGTAMAKLILENIDPQKACIFVIKWYDNNPDTVGNNIKQIEYAASFLYRKIKEFRIDIINMSFNGSQPSATERTMIEFALKNGVTIVTCTGNDSIDIGKCKYDEKIHKYTNCSFPANYASPDIPVGGIKNPNFHIVGCKPDIHYNCHRTNDGGIVTDRASSVYFFDINYSPMVGTSVSTARITNFLLKKMLYTKNK